jgi:NAD(P)H dehydrogenase (quinone)
MSRKALISGATGDTGRAAVKESIQRGLDVRAMVHSRDDRSAALEKLGAEVVVGDLHQIDTIRAAMEGMDAAYFVYPVQPRLIDATAYFAQAAKEAGVIFLMTVETVDEADRLLKALPLDRDHLLTFDLMPIGPLLPLGMLLEAK